MNTRRKLIQDNRHLLYVLSLLAVMLTVYFLPKKKSEQYVFSIGKPWAYNVLIAPFSFSVEKDEASFEAEKDSVANRFAPFFDSRESIAAASLAELEQLYADSLAGNVSPESWRAFTARVRQAYRFGIVSKDDENVMTQRPMLRIRSGNSNVLTLTDSIMGVQSACSYIMQAPVDPEDRGYFEAIALDRYVHPNLSYDREASEKALQEQLDQVSRTAGTVLADQKIIGQGEMVDLEKSRAIRSYLEIVNEKVSSRRFQLFTWGGQSLYVVGCFLFLMLYLMLYRIDDIQNRNILYFLFASVTLFNVGLGLYMQYVPWNVMIVPCTILAIVLRIFLDSRTAFAGYLVFVLTTSVCVPMQYEYVILQIAAGLTGIFSLKELSQRSQILRSCLFIFLTYSLVWFSLQIIKLENFRDIDPTFFLLFAVNCILVLLVYPLLFLIEKTFGFTSNVTLIELSNLNSPLLRELAEKAPGTFQHSMQVSTLASDAATAVKANAALVRTAALYHDIGKIESAPFFTENQNGVNPHDRLTPQQSARIITNHVDAGLALADKYGLPNAIRDFIASHHGTGMAKYFYLKFKQEHPDEEPDIQTFSYSGPDPWTKETAILMMADAAEAASRSLKEYTEDSISELVDRIIDRQVSDGYFRSCPLNWQEIGKIKDVFKSKLRIMYHTRISYPDESTVGQRQKTR